MRGVTRLLLQIGVKLSKFQLTRLMRGVTFPAIINPEHVNYFNSHASCEA